MSKSFSFDSLRRWPDIEADNLTAVDATDHLLLDLASDAIGTAPEGGVVMIGDHYGALTLGAASRFGLSGIRVHQDPLVGELALAQNAVSEGFAPATFSNHELDESLLTGATVVLMQLPKSLDELDDIARAIAHWADESVVVFAGGRLKHMTVTMNEVLGRYFGRIDVSLAKQKSRVLTASERLADVAAPELASEVHRDLGLTIAAAGAAFAGTKIDIGTRALLSVLRKAAPEARDVIDLGAGTGVLAASIAKARPGVRVIATDQSASAVASARQTMEANGLGDRVTVVRDDGLESQPDASADLILLNPPFHIGNVVHTGPAHRMFSDAARVLRPGGELWTVFNTHLAYRQALARIVGPTELVTHNTKFTVTVSTRPGKTSTRSSLESE